MRKNTLNQKLTPLTVARLFNQAASCIDTIESFAAGYEFEPNKLLNLEYPVLFLETPQAINFTPSQRTLTVGFMILNKYPSGIAGERVGDDVYTGVFNALTEELYRLEEVLGVLIRELRNNLEKDFTYTAVPLMEAFEDKCFGWRVDITFKAADQLDFCEVPDNSNTCINLIDDFCNWSYLLNASQNETIEFGGVLVSNAIGTSSTIKAVFDVTCDNPDIDLIVTYSNGSVNYTYSVTDDGYYLVECSIPDDWQAGELNFSFGVGTNITLTLG